MLRLGLAGLGALALACAGGPGGTPPRTEAPPPLESTHATIHAIRVTPPENGVTLVTIEADRVLSWTTYRDLEGHLIVELPASHSVVPRLITGPPSSLVTQIETTPTDGDYRGATGTRLRIMARDDATHALDTRGNTIELRFESARVAEVAPPTATPPADRTADRNMAPPRPVPTAPLPAPGATSGETIESENLESPAAPDPNPAPDPAPPRPQPRRNLAPGSELDDVTLRRDGETWIVAVTGDGPFENTTFRLEGPPRFVVDLRGVWNEGGAGSLELDGLHAHRVRWAQFERSPIPITRIVVDLVSAATEVGVERSDDGLRLRVPADR